MTFYEIIINELQEKLSAEDFLKLQSKIKLQPDEANSFLATDELGNRYESSIPDDPSQGFHSIRHPFHFIPATNFGVATHRNKFNT